MNHDATDFHVGYIADLALPVSLDEPIVVRHWATSVAVLAVATGNV